jgi:hypothetical protein
MSEIWSAKCQECGKQLPHEVTLDYRNKPTFHFENDNPLTRPAEKPS